LDLKASVTVDRFRQWHSTMTLAFDGSLTVHSTIIHHSRRFSFLGRLKRFAVTVFMMVSVFWRSELKTDRMVRDPSLALSE
jgi:hypothetical protein